MSDDATSRRIEGPTPAGGAYAIGFFSHDGRPVPQRFANQMLIVEYDDHDQVIKETWGDCTPEAVLPRDFVAEPGGPSPPDSVLPMLSAALGRSRTAPRERPISEGPPMPTQAVCLARAYVVDSAAQADFAVAFMRAAALLENRDDLDGRWVTTREREAFFQFLDHGAARAAPRLPGGVEEEDVIVIDLGPDRRPATDRLRDVRDRLAADLEASPNEEAAFAAWLATNALASDDISTGAWRDLLEQGRRFTEYFEGNPVSSIPVNITREALAGLRREFEAARSHLMLDLPTAAGARVVESLALAVANARHDPDFDNDAHLRWIYHRFNLALARGPQTERPALHMVAAALASGALDEGFGEQIEALAERELAEADKLVGAALDLSADLDGFYWLLFAAALPLHAAEILYRVLAAGESEPGRFARLANLCEEKHVRVASSVRSDAEDVYTPLLCDARERVQRRLRDEGMLAARQQAIDVIDHTLTFPRWLEGFLLDEHVDGEQFWDELMDRRRPLDTPFAPVPPDASKDA